MHIPSATEVHLVIRLPVPAGQRSTIEQEILQEVLSGTVDRASVKAD
jgi:hypothetical protein